jgi:hypothetical protein
MTAPTPTQRGDLTTEKEVGKRIDDSKRLRSLENRGLMKGRVLYSRLSDLERA